MVLVLVLTCSHPVRGAVSVPLLSAETQSDPPRITLKWQEDPSASTYNIYRKKPIEPDWGRSPMATLPARSNRFADANVEVGVVYDYKLIISRQLTFPSFISAGIQIPLLEDRGTIVLLVDHTIAPALDYELKRLQLDYIQDGWRVIRREVDRNAPVTTVKALIKQEYAKDPERVRAVFLLGHVPIPYSGLRVAPDGHDGRQMENHQGAWPADVYYADMDGRWTDNLLNPAPEQTTLYRLPNRNYPGDGKFDQDHLPSDVELEIGRVDMFHMPEFSPMTEVDLLRQYLDRNHAYRQKEFTVRRRAVVYHRSGGGPVTLTLNNRSLGALFGMDAIDVQDWFPEATQQSFLWGYAGGTGHDRGINGWKDTRALAALKPKVVFQQLFGSYFGDWHTANNFLRAPLAAQGYGLACSWGGAPAWFHHHMALGQTIGYSTRFNQNAELNKFKSRLGQGYDRGIWISLMGDPTLRLHTLAPPTGLTVEKGPGAVRLNWEPSADSVNGYHVYRTQLPANPNEQWGPFIRLTPADKFLSATRYVDPAPPAGEHVYMVRAVKLETSGSGTYFNPSQGILGTVTSIDLMDQMDDGSSHNVPVLKDPEISTPSLVQKGMPVIHPAEPSTLYGAPGIPIRFAYHWETTPLEADYDVFIFYTPAKGSGQKKIVDIYRPPISTRQWSGSLKYDYSFLLPGDIRPGSYEIRTGLTRGVKRVTLAPGPGLAPDDPEDYHQHYKMGTLIVSEPDVDSSQIELSNDGDVVMAGELLVVEATVRDLPSGTFRFMQPMPHELPHRAVMRHLSTEGNLAARLTWQTELLDKGLRTIPFTWWDGKILHTRELKITVKAPTAFDNVIVGFVRDINREMAPLAGVTIQLQKVLPNGARATIVSTVSGEDGAFRTPEIKFRGEFELVAERGGFEFAPVNITLSKGVLLKPVLVTTKKR